VGGGWIVPAAAHFARCAGLFCADTPAEDRPLLFEVEADVGGGDGVPEWLNIFPPLDGEGLCRARDGRVVAFPEGFGPVLRRTQEALEKYGPGAVDLDHELYGWPGGGEASGWMTAIEERAGEGIFARFEPLPRGAAAVESKTYRYTSAVLDADRVVQYDEDGWPRGVLLVAKEFFGFGLTNIPAMRVRSMFSQGAGEDDTMKTATITALLSMLDLGEDATPEQIKTAAQARFAAAASPDPVEFVPRSELRSAREELARYKPAYNAALEAFEVEGVGPDRDAEAVDKDLAERLAEHRTAKLYSAIDEAVADGKLPPAAVEGQRAAYAAMPNGLEVFERAMEHMPQVLDRSPRAAGDPPPKDPATLSDSRPPAGVDPRIWKLSREIRDPQELAEKIRELPPASA
jgi:phage I-like protein